MEPTDVERTSLSRAFLATEGCYLSVVADCYSYDRYTSLDMGAYKTLLEIYECSEGVWFGHLGPTELMI